MDVNEEGLKLYNLLDGKLIYSEVEPTVYRISKKTEPILTMSVGFFMDVF